MKNDGLISRFDDFEFAHRRDTGYNFRMSELHPSIQIIPPIEASGQKIARIYTRDRNYTPYYVVPNARREGVRAQNMVYLSHAVVKTRIILPYYIS